LNRTKRQFKPNLQVKKFYLPNEDKWVTLKVTASGIRNINKLGIEEALKRATAKGFYKG
jgi:large subunit ribosomal protein L28